MIYNSTLKKAIKFSIRTHEVYQKQKRKGKDVPYITHPLIVGLILASAGGSDDVIAAGILHDTIEDCSPSHKVTKRMLADRFGDNVAEIVASVSEVGGPTSWEDRKREAIARIKSYSRGSLLVKSADIVSNVAELLNDYKKEGDKIFSRFGAGKERFLQHYINSANAILARWANNPLADDLRFAVKELEAII